MIEVLSLIILSPDTLTDISWLSLPISPRLVPSGSSIVNVMLSLSPFFTKTPVSELNVIVSLVNIERLVFSPSFVTDEPSTEYVT